MKGLSIRILSAAIAAVALAGCGSKNPQIVTFTATPADITDGDQVTLAWQVTDADTVTLDNGLGKQSANSVTVTPSQDTIYTLSASLSGGVAAQKSLTVTVHPRPAPARIVRFNASKAQLAPGGTVTLSWAVANASAISMTNLPAGHAPLAITDTTLDVSPTVTTTYELSAVGTGGGATATAQAVVRVTPAPVITSFTALPSATGAPRGSSLTLSWVVSGAIAFTIGDGTTTTALGPATSTTVRPTANTTYTLTAIGVTGNTTSPLAVTIAGAPATGLTYLAPAPTNEALVLVKDAAVTPTNLLVLNLNAGAAGFSANAVALNLPFDGAVAGSRDGMTRVELDTAAAASLPSGWVTVSPGFDVNPAALDPGGSASAPRAASARLPTSGPLAGILTLGIAQKPCVNGAGCAGGKGPSDRSIAGGTPLARIRLKLLPDGGAGPIFTGTTGTGFRALVRGAGLDSTAAVGTLTATSN